MKLGFRKKKQTEKPAARKSVIFVHKSFWTQIGWIVFLLAGSYASAACSSVSLFALVLISSFLGLTAFGRWAHRTNLAICSAVAITGSMTDIFSWTDVVLLLAAMCVACGFVLHYRDMMRSVLPEMSAFADVLSYCASDAEAAWKAQALLQRMQPSCKVFVLLADGAGVLYLPEHDGKPSRKLSRAGGVVWKCYAGMLPYRRVSVVFEKDLPLYKEARSLIAAPMTACGEVLGVIEIDSRIPSFFSAEDKDKLSLLAALTAQAVYALRAKE
ncbi:MAG: hypothetical protein Q4E34_02965 [Synergistaceae bacterium]|nr:hypothetical protein [Synergistaceae bacterium]